MQRQQIIKTFCSQGLGIVFETAVTLHECELPSLVEKHAAEENGSKVLDNTCSSTDQRWQTLDYGIPAVTVEGGTLQLRIHDTNSGEMLRRFSLSEDSCYSELSSHFHAFVDHTHSQDANIVHCFGISTPDEIVAKKMLTTVNQIIPYASHSLSELGVPPPKRGRFENEGSSSQNYDDWVVIESNDVLKTQGKSEVMEDGESDDDNETDGALIRVRTGNKRRRLSQERTRSLVISEPKDFRHIAHVGQDTSVSNMTKAMSVDVGQSPDISICSSVEPGTEETTSFVGVLQEDLPVSPPPVAPPAPVPPPPPPIVNPPAPVKLMKKSSGTNTLKQSQSPIISLDEILKKRGTLRSIKGEKLIPEPPPKPDRAKLVSEINTFNRNTLKHVEHNNSKDCTDVDDPNCLQSILRAGLEKMREKLSADFSHVGTVDNKGDEYGFGDECDGPLFTQE